MSQLCMVLNAIHLQYASIQGQNTIPACTGWEEEFFLNKVDSQHIHTHIHTYCVVFSSPNLRVFWLSATCEVTNLNV